MAMMTAGGRAKGGGRKSPCFILHPVLHTKSGTQVVEEGWKAERLKGPQAVRRFSFQPSGLSAFGSGSEPTPCAKPLHPSCVTPGASSCEPGPQHVADRYAVGPAFGGNRLIRFAGTAFAQHRQYAPGDDAVEETLAVDVRRQDGLGALPQRAEEVVDLAVLGADRPRQGFLPRAGQGRRLAARGDGGLDTVLLGG